MYLKIVVFLVLVSIFSGCSDSKVKKNLDGEKLLKQKCASCHNLDLPPKTYEDEKAPPMMAVSFHITDFIKVNDESSRIPKAVDFVKDYVINPSAEKSFCDKDSLKTYGVMPSQKGLVSEDELDAIARYIFMHFTPQNLSKEQKLLQKLKKMPKGQKLAIKNNCLSCHRLDKDLVGPSFKRVLKRDENNHKEIYKAIKKGSKGKYKSSRGAVMPGFKNLSDEDIKTIVSWMKSTTTDKVK